MKVLDGPQLIFNISAFHNFEFPEVVATLRVYKLIIQLRINPSYQTRFIETQRNENFGSVVMKC